MDDDDDDDFVIVRSGIGYDGLAESYGYEFR